MTVALLLILLATPARAAPWLSLSRPTIAPGELVTVTLSDAPIGAAIVAPAGFVLVETAQVDDRTIAATYRLTLAPPGPAWFCAAGRCDQVSVRGVHVAYMPSAAR